MGVYTINGKEYPQIGYGSDGGFTGLAKDIKGAILNPFTRGSSQPGVDASGNLANQSNLASDFAGQGQKQFGNLGRESAAIRGDLRDIAGGKNSISAEQLRQGLQQNQAAHMSMAAGAAPQNQAMAARTAMMGMGRAASGMAGQQAIAGMQERQQAQQALANMLMQQRQQELQAALGSRGQALQGFGTIEQSATSRYGADMGTPTGAETLLGSIPKS